MSRKKILLLSVSAGAGHVRAAEAIKKHADGYDTVETLHLDVMNYVPKTFRKVYVDSYLKLVKDFPTLWGLLYKKIDVTPATGPLQKLRRAVERLNTGKLLKAVNGFNPDAVVCTHFLPAEILMHQIIKNKFDKPVWVQVTDFDVHQMWLIPKMQGYFVANDEVAFRLQQKGISKEQIHIIGIPIMPQFVVGQDRSTHCKTYGLSPDIQTLLLMGGGVGMGGLDEVAGQLLQQSDEFQLIVLAGKNNDALQALQKIAEDYPNRLFPQGFTDEVEQFMACADLVITKSGGLTSSECLAMGLPMLINSPIPGQEERNADYLLEQGCAMKAADELGLMYRTKLLMSDPQRLEIMRKNAKRIARPLAGRALLEIVLEYLQDT